MIMKRMIPRRDVAAAVSAWGGGLRGSVIVDMVARPVSMLAIFRWRCQE